MGREEGEGNTPRKQNVQKAHPAILPYKGRPPYLTQPFLPICFLERRADRTEKFVHKSGYCKVQKRVITQFSPNVQILWFTFVEQYKSRLEKVVLTVQFLQR